MKKNAYGTSALIREAQRQMETDWKDKPREEQINLLRRKYTDLMVAKRISGN